jgi:DNA-binding NtrC family response regulator
LSNDTSFDSWEPVKDTPFRKIKKVSGRLKRMFTGHSPAEQANSPLPRLLIVDDEESICFSMSEYFVLHGFVVDTARELEEAEKLIGNTEYSVVIQDLRLGANREADGLEMIKLLQQHSPATRVVVLTAFGSPEVEDEARRYGADAFLRKPKPLSQVAQVVQGLIEAPPKRVARSA